MFDDVHADFIADEDRATSNIRRRIAVSKSVRHSAREFRKALALVVQDDCEESVGS